MASTGGKPIVGWTLLCAAFACGGAACGGAACGGAGDAPTGSTTAGVGGGGATSVGSTASSTGGHGCFSTETTCDGKCVDVDTNPEHCGMCGRSCATGPNTVGRCVDGQCSSSCAEGFADDMGVCRNFFGAHEAYPAACAGCAVQNPKSGACACPADTSTLPLKVQSDCPGMPMRAATELNLCVTSGVASDSDFGGAYQEDDVDGWCGATAKCRVANPQAGDTCACPAGFESIALRSIIRLPCDQSEVGTTVYLCSAPSAPLSTFGGAYQFDDFAPQCRVTNPRTGDCSCPPGTNDQAYRVMVDGQMGLYGSTIHLCTP